MIVDHQTNSGIEIGNFAYMVRMGVKLDKLALLYDHMGPHHGVNVFLASMRWLGDGATEDHPILPLGGEN